MNYELRIMNYEWRIAFSGGKMSDYPYTIPYFSVCWNGRARELYCPKGSLKITSIITIFGLWNKSKFPSGLETPIFV